MPQWWETDRYIENFAVPAQFEDLAGPKGVALVRTWKDGTTDPGWGLQAKPGKPAFMEKYTKGRFKSSILTGWLQNGNAFAFIMRSMRLVCIDIDGKNGGLLHAGKLGNLPYTLAETSKSGDGYHLFYAVAKDEWDDELGFAMFADRIGLEQGVDFRATGCVYHYPSQRWNGRLIAELPDHLKTRLTQHTQKQVAQSAAILKVLDNEDDTEVIIMQDQLLQDLKKPIPQGRRNNTLFAIGQQLKLAKVPGWEKALHDRALAVGLIQEEADKLVSNVQKYN